MSFGVQEEGEDVEVGRPGFVARFMGAGGGDDDVVGARYRLGGGGGGGGLLPEGGVGEGACIVGEGFEGVASGLIPPRLTFANRDFKSFTPEAGGVCSLVTSCRTGCAVLVGGGLNLLATA